MIFIGAWAKLLNHLIKTEVFTEFLFPNMFLVPPPPLPSSKKYVNLLCLQLAKEKKSDIFVNKFNWQAYWNQKLLIHNKKCENKIKL